MTALIKHFKLLGLSLTADGLAIYPNYPKFDYIAGDKLKRTLLACQSHPFVMSLTSETKASKDFREFSETHSRRYYDNREFCKPNHFFNEELLFEGLHFYIKFHSVLNRDQFVALCDVFVTHELMNEDEKKDILLDYDQRYQLARDNVDRLLSGKANEDITTLIICIHNCKDNDILTDFHHYFLSDKFDYLRDQAADASFKTKWPETDQAGRKNSSTRAWSMLEKAIAIKITMNTRSETTSGDLANKRASQFEQAHHYYTKKHQAPLSYHRNNKPLEPFEEKQSKALKK